MKVGGSNPYNTYFYLKRPQNIPKFGLVEGRTRTHFREWQHHPHALNQLARKLTCSSSVINIFSTYILSFQIFRYNYIILKNFIEAVRSTPLDIGWVHPCSHQIAAACIFFFHMPEHLSLTPSPCLPWRPLPPFSQIAFLFILFLLYVTHPSQHPHLSYSHFLDVRVLNWSTLCPLLHN